jgi:RNA polymerase sigma-70 factor (ECF subfamily)
MLGQHSNGENFELMATNPAPVSEKIGDPADWVDRYGDLLLRYACSRLSDRELAEDLVQETLLAAFRHRKQFDGKSAFSTWLVAILRRKIADHYRTAGKSPEILDSAQLELAEQFSTRGKWLQAVSSWNGTPAQLAENAEFWSVFQNCLAGLPGHLAQAFQLREVMHSPVDEVGRKLGITAQNVAVRLHRARLLLKSCLSNKWFS